MTELITLDRARQAVPAAEPDADHILTPLIEAASAAIERHCSRSFASAGYNEYYDGDGDDTLLLKHFPVTEVARVSASPQATLQITNTDTSTNSRATVRVTDTGLVLTRVAAGSSTSNTLTFATYPTISSLAAAVDSLGSGWAATIVTGWGSRASADLIACGGKPCLGEDAECKAMSEEIACSVVDGETGRVRMDSSPGTGSRNIRVEYTAGFAAVPDDVQLACATMVSNAYHALERDGGLRSERLGDYAFTAESDTIFTAQARRLLAPYRDYQV
jgi:hypothetical protein